MAVILIWRTIVAFLSSETIQLLAIVFNVRQFFQIDRFGGTYMLQETYNVGSTVTHTFGNKDFSAKKREKRTSRF